MVDFNKLKANRANALTALNGEIKKMNTGGNDYNKDAEKYWAPTVDSEGNGFAVIRFLPAFGDEANPFVKLWSHGFKGPTGKWYIENSLTTLGKDNPDPVSEYNKELWDSGIDANREIVSKFQKRRLHYISNILVVSDKKNPENEGKVFLYKYGKKIFDKIETAIDPKFEGDVAFNPFDMWTGANFKLKIRKVEGQRSYDLSGFDNCSAISDDDDVLAKIYESEHSLDALVSPDNFKSYDVLQKHLFSVLGINTRKPITDPQEPVREVSKAAAPSAPVEEKSPWDNEENEDADLSFFKKLAED